MTESEQSLNESLSAAIDGEAEELELRRVLNAVGENPDLRAKWQRLHLIGGVLRRETAPVVRSPLPAWPADIDTGDGHRDTVEDQGVPTLTPEPANRRFGGRWVAGVGSAALATAAALIVGIVLIVIVGWPILIIGGASLIAAVTYTGGPLPYGYRGLGDPICFLFFGFVAVMGAGYVQIEELTWELAAASVPVGCLVTAILVVNNLRDIDTDRVSDKRTLAVMIGERNTRLEYALLTIGAFVAIAVFASVQLLPYYCYLAWIGLPPAMWLAREIIRGRTGSALNPMLKRTAQLHLLVGAMIGVGGVVSTF